MKNTAIGFERFEEDFSADINTMYIKPENADSANAIQIVKPSFEQRSSFYERWRKIDNVAKVSLNDSYMKNLCIKRGG
jgi:hypothetical protein